MQFLTSTYFQRSRNDSALLLQHYRYKRTSLCLIGLSAAEGQAQGRAAAYLTEQLLEWFRRLPWRRVVSDPEGYLPEIGIQLQAAAAQAADELASCGLLPGAGDVSLTGIFCIGEHFLLFHRGRQKIYLFNRSFGRGTVRCVSDELAAGPGDGLAVRQGSLQRDVCLMFATESFCGSATKQELAECLHVTDVLSEEHADRRLRELGERGAGRGGCHMAAALLMTREEGGKRSR